MCDDLDSLLSAVEAEQPDVVVTDIRMPPGETDEGIQAAARLRETHPGIGVVVLSQYATPSYVLALLEGQRRARLSVEGAREGSGATRRGDPNRRCRRLLHGPEGGRGAGRRELSR